jgi:2,4-dienoyl-CoA reductase-like NADH-dependent reductase (Old Yellow Enzyme family)
MPSLLFEPYRLRGLTLRNRLVVSPMCQYSSEDGLANEWHLVHLGSRAVGGAGLVFTEATAVEPIGRISAQDLGLWHAPHVAPLRRITDFIKSQGAVPGIQLAHAGRKASTLPPWDGGGFARAEQGGWIPVAPSAIPFLPEDPAPAALSLEAIAGVTSAFRNSASLALEAGFQVSEIHAAHGYLLHQFLSPLSNHRDDAYGGTLENRMRLVLETVKAVRSVWPDELPLWVRLSVTDWMGPEAWDIEDSVALAKRLKQEGVDVIDCSSGGAVPGAVVPAGPGYQTGFAERLRREVGIATGAVGLITDPAQAETILRTGQADVVLVAREFLRDPYFARHAASRLHHKLPWPRQYGRVAD